MSNVEFPYEIIEEYVRGGCSVIYKIKQREDLFEGNDAEYVLKTMSVMENDPQSVQRFYMEYEFLRAYPHPNLVQVKDYFQDWHGRPAYVMEWVEGDTWLSYWHERPVLEDPRHFLHIFKQFCEVIDYIHKHQIIHRDLKPQNVLISHQDVLKLIDFGIMKVADLTLFTHHNTFMGSAYYVAPEGISGETVTNTADIFSLGVMLYDLFTGMKPFQGHTLGETIYQRLAKKPQPPSQIADVPKELDKIILKMMERDPHQRQPNCHQVFEELEAVFGRFEPAAMGEQPEIDILTKGPLLHGPFINAAESYMRDKNVIYICGTEGSGKTTIVENTMPRFITQTVLRMECRESSTELEFMELILRHLSSRTSFTREMGRWKEILAGALPGLLWPVGHEQQTLNPGMIQTAFKKVLQAINKPAILVIEDLQNARPALLKFINDLAQLIATRANAHLYLCVTSVKPVSAFWVLGEPFIVNFPDILSLSEYLSGQFGGGRIPLELCETLAGMAEQNVGKFLRLVQNFKESGRLTVQDGVLILAHGSTGPAVSAEEGLATIPSELNQFNHEEMTILEWVALCPDGVNMNILKMVTRQDLGRLGAAIDKASLADLLEFQSSVTEGFRWRSETVRHFLVSSLAHEEKLKRYRTLAKNIESESAPYLPYSPPLWVILCRLYQQAGDDTAAADYAFRYARYCAQTANYEPIRTLLSQFVPLPEFRENQEFWCMLALANTPVDPGQALYFAKKALRIGENSEVLALLAILEYAGGNPPRTRVYIHKIFTRGGIENLDIQYASQLMPILMALGEITNARNLLEMLQKKLKGRDDLFATNTLVLATLEYAQTRPQNVLKVVSGLKQELLPETRRLLNHFVCRAHMQLFQYDKALATLKFMDLDAATDPSFYTEWLFLQLWFGKTIEVKHLCSGWRRHRQESESMERLAPLIQLVTEILVDDPKIYDFEHLNAAIIQSGAERSTWMALVSTQLDFEQVSSQLLSSIIAMLDTSSIPMVRHHIPRLRIQQRIKENQVGDVDSFLRKALDYCNEHGLVTEQLRLYALWDYAQAKGWSQEELDFTFSSAMANQSLTQQFLLRQYRAKGNTNS